MSLALLFNFQSYSIRENGLLTIQSDLDSSTLAPFRVCETQIGYQISFCSHKRLTINLDGIKIFDGHHCQSSIASEIHIHAKFGQTVEIIDELHHQWKVFIEYSEIDSPFSTLQTLGRKIATFQQAGSFNFPFAVSLFLIIGLIVFTCTYAFKKQISAPKASRLAEAGSDFLLGASKPIPIQQAFSGISLHEFITRQTPNLARALVKNQPKSLLSGLASFNKELSLPNEKNQNDPSRMSALSQDMKSDTTLQAALDHANRTYIGDKPEKNNTPLSQSGVSSLSTQDNRQTILKTQLGLLKPKLSKAYDEALRIDPAYQGTVAYQAKVGRLGRLTEVTISLQSKSAPQATAILKATLERLFESITLGKELEGITFSGEQIFLK